MIHIENIPHILKYGITHARSTNANTNFISIGDSSLINTRNNFSLKNGKKLGEYIPFYFGTRTPMLYVMQNGYGLVKPTPPENIVYCVSSIQKIIDANLDFIFTNGHAVDGFTSQFIPDDVNNIEEIIDWNSVNAKYWKDDNDLDLKRRKEAEFLVSEDISINAIGCYCVYNEVARQKMIDFGIDDSKIVIKNEFYF